MCRRAHLHKSFRHEMSFVPIRFHSCPNHLPLKQFSRDESSISHFVFMLMSSRHKVSLKLLLKFVELSVCSIQRLIYLKNKTLLCARYGRLRLTLTSSRARGLSSRKETTYVHEFFLFFYPGTNSSILSCKRALKKDEDKGSLNCACAMPLKLIFCFRRYTRERQAIL